MSKGAITRISQLNYAGSSDALGKVYQTISGEHVQSRDSPIPSFDRRIPVLKGSFSPHSRLPTDPDLPDSQQKQNHSTSDSQMVPHSGTNEAATRLALESGRDPAFSCTCGHGYAIG